MADFVKVKDNNSDYYFNKDNIVGFYYDFNSNQTVITLVGEESPITISGNCTDTLLGR